MRPSHKTAGLAVAIQKPAGREKPHDDLCGLFCDGTNEKILT